MQSSKNPQREFGEKLLPKLIKAVSQSVIATKLGLTSHELNVRINSGQELIDRMGHEGADLYRGLMDEVLSQDNIAPILRDFIERAASGDNQWQAAGEFIWTSGGISSAFGDVFANALAPTIRGLNRISPNLNLPVDGVARAVASGLYDVATGESVASGYGYNSAVFQTWTQLSQTWPDVSTIAAMVNRGIIEQQTANALYRRLGFENDLLDSLLNMQETLPSVADAALAVLRGDLTESEGASLAIANGYTSDSFKIFLANTGEPPGSQELQEALRRGFINEATFKKGILQSRVRDEWIPTLLALRYSPLSTADAVNAYVEGYVSEATVQGVADKNGLEPGQYKILVEAAGDPLSYTDMMRLFRYGKATENDVRDALKRGRLKDDYIDFALALRDSPMSVADAIEARVQGYLGEADSKAIASMNGLREQDYDPLYLSAGDPLPKEEMLRLFNRGKVTLDQVKAALRQSRLKDSYIDTAVELRTQLPALYEVRALLADGSLTAAQGTNLLLEGGYTPDIVTAIVNGATGVGSSASKQLTLSIYTNLYQEGAISSEEFQQELLDLGYSEASAQLLQAEIDFKVTLSARNSVISKVKAAYIAGKISEAVAQADLNALDLNAEAVDRLISDWEIEKSTNVRTLTAAQVTDAWFMNLFNQSDPADNLQQALTYLGTLGYDGPDSILILSIKNKGPLTNATTQQSGSSAPSAPAAAGSTGAAQ